MAQIALIKVIVTSKKGGLFQLMQKRDDFTILHSFSPDLKPDLIDTYAPATQQAALVINNVLIQDIHAAIDPNAYLFALSRNACLDNLTASAMAS